MNKILPWPIEGIGEYSGSYSESEIEPFVITTDLRKFLEELDSGEIKLNFEMKKK